MADFLKNLQGVLGVAKSTASSVASADVDDFADFATAASPAAPSHDASSTFSEASSTATPKGLFAAGMGMAGRPYTKWYRVWERVTIADFYQEMVIIPILVVIIVVTLWGASLNRKRAKQWAQKHLPLLRSEFASVGFGGGKRQPSANDVQSKGLVQAQEGNLEVPAELYKEKSKSEYITYCTGRQNVAWLDIKLSLYKRYNPLLWFGEQAISFFFDTYPAPVERLEATAYCFDGKEKAMVPMKAQGTASPGNRDSSFDGFVWAIVHKDKMKELRNDRYDLSLTSTKDHGKLPQWVTIMSESAEVTDAMLTPDLIKAVNEAGEDLEALIVSDQPIDAPKKLNDTVPRKRVSLAMRINPTGSTALFSYFLRLPDHLVTGAHFRPEALRKIKATREEEQRKLRKADEDEKAEERRLASDKLKKEERDRKLSKMSAEEQRKFLEKEKEKSQRKGMKKQTMRA